VKEITRVKTITRELQGSESGAVTIEYIFMVMMTVGIGGSLMVMASAVKDFMEPYPSQISDLVDNLLAGAV
jgi:hypothetical protein